MHDKLHLAIHGAIDVQELEMLELRPDDVIDFSANINPFGPSPRIHQALQAVRYERYPDRACLTLRRTICTTEMPIDGITPSSIVCGNGASELIWAIARAWLGPQTGVRESSAAMIGPTFGEYAVASNATGARCVEYTARAAAAFQPDIEQICARIIAERPTIVWLCQPNNPTGTLMSEDALHQIWQACWQQQTMLMIDESYWRFVFAEPWHSSIQVLADAAGQLPSNVIVLRSLTKDYALPAFRLGYVVAAPQNIARIEAQLPAWNVNGLAQVAGTVAMQDGEHLMATLTDLQATRERFFMALQQIMPIVPSRTHYCLIPVADAKQVRQRLLEHRLVVRDCTSFGLPCHIRVATRRQPENHLLLQALQEVI